MNNCQSCGMPMTKPEDHGGGRLDNPHCRHCTDDQGNLLPRDEVREKMVNFHIQNLEKTREQAEADVDKHMSIMPAWKLAPVGPKPTVSSTPVRPSPPPRPASSQPGPGMPKPSGPVTQKPSVGLGPSGFPRPLVKPTGPNQPLSKPPSDPLVQPSPSVPSSPATKPELPLISPMGSDKADDSSGSLPPAKPDVSGPTPATGKPPGAEDKGPAEKSF